MRVPLVQASQLVDGGLANALTTGYPDLDGLIGGLLGGQLYLFYGSPGFVDKLVHVLLVKGSRLGKVAYMNNTDYYSDKTLLNVDRIAFYAKREGIDPSRVLKRVYFVAAYNELRQPKATKALEGRIRLEGSTKLVVAHRVSRFLDDARDRRKALENLNRSLSTLWHISVKRNLAMVMTADPVGGGLTRLPRPSGTSLMRHMANVMVFFRESGRGKPVRAVLVKHPEKETPAIVRLRPKGDALNGKNNAILQADVPGAA